MEGALSSSFPGKQRRLDDSAVKLGTRKRVLGSRGERKWKRIRVRKKQRELKEKAKSSGGKRKATQQLNSVSGGRGREIGAGRTKKLIEAVIKTLREAIRKKAPFFWTLSKGGGGFNRNPKVLKYFFVRIFCEAVFCLYIG